MCVVICDSVPWKFCVSVKSLGMILLCIQSSRDLYLGIAVPGMMMGAGETKA